MNRFLQIFNLVGVVLLITLCGVQWMANRGLHLETLALEQKGIEQGAKIAEQEKTIAGNVADLENFRGRVERAEADAKDLAGKLTVAEAERDGLKTDVEKLRESVKQWTAATAARDESIKQQGAQIQKLADARNQAVLKFNDLATKYNGAIGELNKAGEQIQKLVKERDDAVAKFNGLADQYNALLKAQDAKGKQ